MKHLEKTLPFVELLRGGCSSKDALSGKVMEVDFLLEWVMSFISIPEA